MAEPDVRIRLSAEGVAEVVGALRKIEGESNRASRGATKGFAQFSGTLSNIGKIAGIVGAAIAAIGIGRFAKDVIDGAETLQNLHLRLATNVRDLHAMDVALQRMGTSLPESSRAMTTLLNLTQDAATIGGEAADKFKRLGLTTEEIKKFAKQDIAQRIEAIAKASRRLGDEKERTAAFIDALSTRGAILIPLLDEVANKGIAGLRDQAAGLSSDIDTETVESIGRLNDAFDDLRIQSRGLATQFVAGLAPSITGAIGAVNFQLSRGAAGWRAFGEATGAVLGFIVAEFLIFSDLIATTFITIGKTIGFAGKAAKALARGDLSTARLEIESIGLAWDKALEDQRNRTEVIRRRVSGESVADGTGRTLGPTEDEAGEALERFNRLAKARQAARAAELDADIKIAQTSAKLQAQVDERAFNEGLIGVREYYDRRRRIAVEAINAEIAALQKKRTATAAADDPKALAELAKIDGEIKNLAIERAIAIDELGEKESQEVKRLGKERLEIDRKVFEARGAQHEANLAQIDEEIAKARLVFEQSGLAANEVERRVSALRSALGAQEGFDRASIEANKILTDFGVERDRLQQRIDAGLVSQIEGETAIRRIEESRVEVLRKAADQMRELAARTTDPELSRRAEEFAASVGAIEIAIERERNVGARIRATFGDAAREGLEEFFATGIREARNFGEAMQQMATSVINAMQRMAAQMLATQIIAGIFGLFGSAAATPTQGGRHKIPNPTIPSKAEGGFLDGDGPQMIQAHGGEYVVRSRAVARPGVLAALEAINRGSGRVRGWGGGRSFAEGGLVGGTVGAARIDGSVTVGLEEGLVLRALESDAGERLIVRTVTKNRRAIGR